MNTPDGDISQTFFANFKLNGNFNIFNKRNEANAVAP